MLDKTPKDRQVVVGIQSVVFWREVTVLVGLGPFEFLDSFTSGVL